MTRKVLFVIAASLTLCVAATAGALAASPAPSAPDMSVSARGLDLANAYDADRYLNRIEAAARRVCGADLKPHPLSVRLAHERCVNTTMRRTVARIEAPAVAARYAQRGDTVMVALR
ncbi:MAG TPA: UrcA family protein [Caulobacterales bacterium]|nr:UrcA family protein [Caulobacterales bacterium]